MKVAFYTLGCKVNQYETKKIANQFLDKGYDLVEFNELSNPADIYVINSCSVTNLSSRKTRTFINKAKKYNKNGIVILIGCYAHELKSEIEQRSKLNVELILGNDEKFEIVNKLENYLQIRKENSSDFLKENKKVYKLKTSLNNNSNLQNIMSIRESIKIEDGCNNFCSYCIIPFLRGRVKSRDLDEIVNESKKLIASGVKELVLVGIEIASYGKDLDNDLGLIDVVEKISKLDGLLRLRLGSIEPRWLTDENIIRISKVDKLCNQFHLSVQSLDNQVLKSMNRKYTKEFIIDRVKKIREHIKDVAFTADIIVAFPGETDLQFKNTISVAKQIGFSKIHVFKYSKRKFTKAATMENQIDGNIAIKRSNTLISVAKELEKSYISGYIGKKVKVLFESYDNGYLEGYTSNYIKIRVLGDENLWGTIQEVELISLEKDKIIGEL